MENFVCVDESSAQAAAASTKKNNKLAKLLKLCPFRTESVLSYVHRRVLGDRPPFLLPLMPSPPPAVAGGE